MNIEYVKIKELQGYEFNTRTHSDEQVDQLVASIGEFGFTNPLLIDGERQIIAGHGRLAAATKIGMEDVPCIVLDHLSEAQRRAYVIADNKLALNAGWDEDLLKLELSALDQIGFDLSVVGFDADELSGLVIDEDIAGGLTDEDEVPEVAEIPISKQDDIWLLDNHRVMCGDSTSADDVAKLMDGQMADMVFTDPPYGVNMSRSLVSGKDNSIKNDTMDGLDLLLDGAFENAFNNSKENINVYCWIGFRAYNLAENIFNKYWPTNNCVVWKKPSIGLGGKGYRSQHELCIFSGSIDDRSQSDIWEFNRDRSGLHPTMKPVDLITKAIINSSKKNDLIIDLFLGSGSTLIASQKNKRQCYGMELDPRFVDVIVKRWQEYTGKQAVHSVSGLTFDEVADAKQVA